MPKRGRNLRDTLPRLSASGYHALMVSFRNLSGFENNDVAMFRQKALNHLYQFGWKAAVAAYEVKKSTLFGWKKRFENSGRKLISLVPTSTRPKTTRLMVVDPRLAEFIRSMRETYGPVSKYKLKPFLDEYAKTLGIAGYGREKIGKIIKRNHYFFESGPKIKKRAKPLVSRLKKAPKQTEPGYIEMDSITLYVNTKKYYFVTAIDIVTKFARVTLTRSLSSLSAKQALVEFTAQYPYSIREVQTDNGHEFLGEFDDYLKTKDIPHQFIYFHSPKINGVVERFNRTIQDEFLNRNDELWYDLNLFSQKLAGYLEWYNTKRPHHSLDLKPPVIYMQKFQT
jgi:hypothetical protein